MTRWVLCAAATLLMGCTYQTGTLMPRGVRRVAVEVFGNETRYRHIELTFTGVLRREMVQRAYISLRDPEEAEAIVRGTILVVGRRPLVEGRRDEEIESSVLPRVRVEMVDAKTGTPLIAPMILESRRAESILPRGETLQTALDEVMDELAKETLVRLEALSLLESPLPTAGDR